MVNIDKIFTLARERGISQTHICEKMNVRRSYFVEKRNRGGNISEDKLEIIADILGTTVEYLTDETDNPSPKDRDAELDEYLTMLKNRSEMKMLFSVCEGATKEDVMQAVKIIEALKNK